MHIQRFSFPSVFAKSEGCLGKILGCEIAGGPLNNPHKTAEQAGHILICKKTNSLQFLSCFLFVYLFIYTYLQSNLHHR